MAIASDALVRDKLYIGGEWVEPTGDGSIEVVNPTTEEVIGRVPDGTAEDADRAVRAAREAFETWSQTPAEERAKRVASRIRTGQVEINGGAFNPMAPFGGYKQSGHGREMGRYGLEEFLVAKSLQL